MALRKLNLFADDFSEATGRALTDLYFPGSGATQYVTVVNGAANLPASQDVWKGLETQEHFDATNSSIFWDMAGASHGNGALSLVHEYPNGVNPPLEGFDWGWQYDADASPQVIKAIVRGAGTDGAYVESAGTVTIAYDRTMHKSFKIEQVGSTINWYWSADRISWTLARTATMPTNFVPTDIKLVFGAYSSVAATPMIVDNINIAPTLPPTVADASGFDDVGVFPATTSPTQGASRFDDVGGYPVGVINPPGPVLSTFVLGGDGSATISWQPPSSNGGSPVTGYTITPTPATGVIQQIPAGTLSTVFTGLINGTSYTFTVVPNNLAGPGTSTTTAAVIPAPATTPPPGGGGGSTPPPPVIDPTPTTAPGSDPTNGAANRTVAGQVLTLFLEDLDTHEVLQLTPSLGYAWLTDFDPGWPDPREVVSSFPDRSGTIDETKFHANRAVTIGLRLVPSIDLGGNVQPAGAYLDRLRAWTRLGRNIRLGYQVRGQSPRLMYIRPSQLSAPLIGSGTGREVIDITLGFKCPDGLTYEQPPAGAAVLQQPLDPTYYVVSAGAQAGGTTAVEIKPSGIQIAPSGIDLSGVSTIGGQAGVETYDGSVPSAPLIYMYGGAVQPKFAVADAKGNKIAKLEFTANGGLTVAANQILIIDVAKRTCVVTDGVTVTNVRGYLQPPIQWRDFLMTPPLPYSITNTDGSITTTLAPPNFLFYPQSANVGTRADFAFRVAYI